MNEPINLSVLTIMRKWFVSAGFRGDDLGVFEERLQAAI